MSELVSIYMLAYNHVQWIEKAIQSIINQKTNFDYKLYIHDDASTDGTTEIVRKYAEQYPEKIMAFFEEENQYSKGVKITRTIMLPYMNGKYIASCEGDDYWIEPKKLQLQVDYMENHPGCSLCFSNALIVDTENNILKRFLPFGIWNDKNINIKLRKKCGSNFSTEEIILLDFTPTASNLYKMETYKNELSKFGYGLDLLTRLVATNAGYAHYHNETFTAYRTGNSGSASGSIINSFEKTKKSYYEKHKMILNDFDKYTEYKYTNIIQHEINRKEVELYINFDYEKTKSLKCYKELTIKKRMKLFLKHYFSAMFNILKRIRYKNTTIR